MTRRYLLWSAVCVVGAVAAYAFMFATAPWWLILPAFAVCWAGADGIRRTGGYRLGGAAAAPDPDRCSCAPCAALREQLYPRAETEGTDR